MSILRRIFRPVALILWHLYIISAAGLWKLRGESGALGVAEFTRRWMVGACRIVNLNVRVKGRIPKKRPGLIISNHLGYVDILAQGSLAPFKPTPKSDIAKWPLIGAIVGCSWPIWIDRASKSSSTKAAAAFAKAISRGISILVYPEGTSSDGRKGVLPFKSTPFEAAILSGAPVYPVHIRYKQTEVPFHGDMAFETHLWHLLGLPRIDAEVRVLKPIMPRGLTRKELADRTRQAIQEVDDRLTKRSRKPVNP